MKLKGNVKRWWMILMFNFRRNVLNWRGIYLEISQGVGPQQWRYVQEMAWHRKDKKPLPEAMMKQLIDAYSW